jgi:hypothetical protein
LIVFEDQDEGRSLRGGEIQSFVECAGGAAAVAYPSHGDNILAEIAAGHGHAGHHRNQIAEHGDGRDDVADFEVAEVAGAVLALRGRSEFRHVLRENVARLETLYEQRTDIADHGGEPVARFERVGRADRHGFLAERGIDAADDFVLAEERDEAVFEPPVELHVVVEVEESVVGEVVMHRSEISFGPVRCFFPPERFEPDG